MLKTICKAFTAIAFVSLVSLPATAEVSVRADIPLPGLEIRIAHSAPPKARSEHRPGRPGRDYVWVDGFWHWEGSRWGWIPGRWDRPTEHGAKWVKARYAREGSVWRYEPAHWSHQHLIEGDDYRHWKAENDRGHHGGDRDHDHDKDHQR